MQNTVDPAAPPPRTLAQDGGLEFPGQARPGSAARLRDIAVSLGITRRSASGIVTGMTAAGYAVKHKDGHHNRYQIQARHPLPTCQPGTCRRRSPGPPGE